MNPEQRFWAKVDRTGDCWIWLAHRDRHGYGTFALDGRKTLAHRLAYEWLVGPIPEGLQIDHLCRNRACVNPSHMEPVTNRENSLRGIRATKLTCARGHPYDAANTYRIKKRGAGLRHCRACNRDAAARYRRRKAA